MRALFFLLLTLISSKAFGIYLLVSEGEIPSDLKQRAYHEVLLKEDYPLSLMAGRLPPSNEVMNQKLSQIHPKLKAQWVPTSLFQLFVLHEFFVDGEFREFVKELGYSCGYRDKNDHREKEKFGQFQSEIEINIDDEVVKTLSDPNQSNTTLYSLYEKINHHERFCRFFLKINDAFCKAYSPGMLESLRKEIPCEKEVWESNHFPFLYNQL